MRKMNTKQSVEQKTFDHIKQHLRKNANLIQKEATRQHEKYLKVGSLRTDFIRAYEDSHVLIVKEIARYLDKKVDKGVAYFRKLGEVLAKKSVHDGLTLEEAIDGTIFLKQAIWKSLQKDGLLEELSTQDFFEVSQIIGTYTDTFASLIAFNYHQERLYIENNLSYLAEASQILASSLDYQTTLNTVANLAVPKIGDWCAIDMVDDSGTLQHVAVAHKDPKKVKWAQKLQETAQVDMNASTGVPNVLRTGQPEIYPEITDEMLVRLAKTKQELELARSIGFTSVMIVPIFSQHTIVGAITFVTAETRRNYTQADLIMAMELGARASAAIENARLYKGSQEAITLRDDFISIASHELKTPVTSVKMFTQILKKHSQQIGDEKAVLHLSKMDRQLDKLTELIYDLLNVSKIQAGKIEFHQEMFDFDQAVKEIVDVLQQSVDSHRLVVKGSTNKKVMGDEERIGQVLNNLISNAIKYSPKADQVIIRLSSNTKTIEVAVQDFGIGMEQEHLGRIFEQFYRVYDTTDKTFPGLGIGLYISSEIVNRHGGNFWVDSDVGKGSTFHFSLPIYADYR